MRKTITPLASAVAPLPSQTLCRVSRQADVITAASRDGVIEVIESLIANDRCGAIETGAK